MLYEESIKTPINSFLKGYNSTIIAYGQTGSGKTYTIFGTTDENLLGNGIVFQSIKHIFGHINNFKNVRNFRICVSMIQLYNEVITDLFQKGNTNNTKGLQLKEDPQYGTIIEGLSIIPIKSEADLFISINKALKYRSTSNTILNSTSSRSHALLKIFLEQKYFEKNSHKNEKNVTKSLLTFVDLAGSERLSRSKSEGPRLIEVKSINKSLSCLSMCISALATKKKSHIPFRDSKLTRILEESLSGNSRTTLIACISPSEIQFEETYSTLLFASRAMAVSTISVINSQKYVRNSNSLSKSRNLTVYDIKTFDNREIQNSKTIEKTQSSNQISLRKVFAEDERLKDTIEEYSEKDINHLNLNKGLNSIKNKAIIKGLEKESQKRESNLVKRLLTIIKHLQNELSIQV